MEDALEEEEVRTQEGGEGGRAGLSEREYIGICFVFFNVFPL